ncbi:MAG: mechanosensitive ion channel family protein [Rickettsiales bacterium]|nr:mechanosensitive ion channel family protein [Rickettsiales bacterium]
MLSYASDVRSLVIIISIAWFFNNFVKTYQDFYLRNKLPHRKKIDRATVDTVTTITLIFIYVVTGLSVLQLLGFNISGILALGGAGGIAIGFAAKDLLSNFFGGLMIYFDRPFQVGDWIRSSDKEIEGDVIKIGWRQTQVLTFDKRPIYIPNSVFSTIVVQNPSRMTHRRIRETFGVRYEDVSKLEKITKEVKEYLIKHKEIDENQTLIVNVNEFSNSSIDFFVYTFTHTTNWVKYHEVKQEILLAIAKIIEKNGAEIAFPTSTIHLDQEIERKTKTIQKKTPAKKATKKTSKNTNKK